ncbi:MAG: DpnD/PcfM family protein [Muribaculaceae bacterium]|nr:DpnD/PcfM family protein [Muribaculaceae bacterium]MBO5187447.1 DpnD/PcfM family protein [Prevotella sp.]
MIYEVYITETLCRTEQIEADSKAEAIAKAREAYDKEEIVLDYKDFIEVDFKAVADGDEASDDED